MKFYRFVTGILCFTSFHSLAQPDFDKSSIYNTVIQSFPDKHLPIINETFPGIHNYDIDGDYKKWFYEREARFSTDTTSVIVSLICGLPVKYSQTIVYYLHSKNLPADIPGLLQQTKNSKVDSLDKYIPAGRIISWKKAPISSSFFNLLFKKKKAIGLSPILFDQQNQFAFVKITTFTKNKFRNRISSKIFILKTADTGWTIIDSLDENNAP